MMWLKNIFGSGREEEPSSVNLQDIGAWLDKREELEGFADRMAEIYAAVEPLQRALSQDISDLASADPDSQTPPKLLRAGLAAKGELVKQLQSFEEKLYPPARRDPDSIYQHHWSVLKGLERTVTTFGRAQRYVAALFPKNIERLNSDLGKVSRLLVDMEEQIGKNRKLQEESWFCRDLAGSLQKGQAAALDLKKRMGEMKEELRRTESSLRRLEEDLRRLDESEKGRAVEQMKASLAEAEQQKRQADEELACLISPLSKALARIAKQGSSDRLALQHKDVFSRLRAAPSQMKEGEIAGSLQELRAHLAALGLKDKKKEKTLDHIDMLIRERSLEKAAGRRAALEEEISGIKSRLAESTEEGKLIKEEIARARKKLKSLQADLAQAERDLAAIEERARADEAELNDRLARIAGKPVKVEL